MKIKRRIEEIDIIKCIAIVMVVIGHTHCPGVLKNMCYSIHMPLFFIASGCTIGGGYFDGINEVICFIRKKIKSFYFPFLLFVVPICLLHNAFYELGLYEKDYDLKQYAVQIIRCFSFSIGTNEPWLQQLWFLKTLFLAEVFYALIGYITNKYKIKKLYIALVCIITLVFIRKGIVPHFIEVHILWPIKAWIFLEIGKLLIRNISKSPYILISLIFLISWFACGLMIHFSFQDSLGWHLVMQILLSVSGFICLYFFSSLIKKIDVVKQVTCRIGQDTLYIFFWHYIMFAIISALYSILFCKDCYSMIKYDMRLDCINWSVYVILSIILVEIGTLFYKYLINRK